MDGAGMTLDSTSFDRAVHDMARITGKSLSVVIKSEVQSILSKAMSKTKAASVSNINAHFTYKDPGQNEKTVVYVRLNGTKTRVRSIKRKLWGKDKNKSNPLWKPLQVELKKRKTRAKNRRGLSKATWVLAGKRAGLQPMKSIPGYVSKALALMPNSMRAAVGGSEHGETNYYIQVKNSSYTAMAPGSKKGPDGYAAFKGALIGRKLFFEKNVEKGVFEKAAEIAKKYPGFEVSPS